MGTTPTTPAVETLPEFEAEGHIEGDENVIRPFEGETPPPLAPRPRLVLPRPHRNDATLIAAPTPEGWEKTEKRDRNGNVIPFSECMGCGSPLSMDHTGIICPQNHSVCPDCCPAYVNTVFDDPVKSIPLKCRICHTAIIVETFERQLTPTQLETFLLYNMQFDPTFLTQDEMIVSCPFCEYWEINTIHEGRLMVMCHREGCKAVSCIHCKKKIAYHETKKEELDSKEFEKHLECAQLAPIKAVWDKAIDDGMVVPCPRCGLSGMKNNACTHMTCPRCQAEWCYVCGLELQDLDMEPGYARSNIFGHNKDWETNVKRCPIWLDSIHAIDDRWPKDDSDACVTFLHQIRTKKNLQRVLTEELKASEFKALCAKYNVDQNCGFDIKDVLRSEHILIKGRKS